MKIAKERKLPECHLAKFRIADMRYDEVLTIECDSVSEFSSAYSNAKRAFKCIVREDGFRYKLKTISSENRIIIWLEKE